MKLIYSIIFLSTFILSSCSKVRESAGVTRKSLDEFVVIENPPLVIPPDFNLLPPEQLEEKNIENLERELAQEILFGLDDNKTNEKIQITTMTNILTKADALDINSSIRQEINEDFYQEIDTKSVFNIEFENEVDVLDAIKESKRIREKNFTGESIAEGEVPIKKEIIKKKKRFILF